MTSYLCTPPSFVAQCFIWGCVCVCDWSVVMISASEPNLKVRSALKQKLESQRRITHSPILPRKNKFVKRKPQLSCMYLYIMQGLFFRTQFLFWKHRGMVISIFIFLPSFFPTIMSHAVIKTHYVTNWMFGLFFIVITENF